MAKAKKDPLAGLPKRHRENVRMRTDEMLTPAQAVAALKQFKAPKFDQTVEVVMHLGIDPKQADQALRGAVALPNGIGKSKRVIAFCQSDQVNACLSAGAIKAGGEDLMAEVERGFMDFDVAIATPDMMRVIARLGKVLGPKGLMPSPKAGTVTPNVADAVREYAAGKVEFRNDAGGNIHSVVGKLSFSTDKLVDNINAMISQIRRMKPQASKGAYFKKVVIKATMTPAVQLAVQ
jgi:large subunit ribosomal protein L1